jgi:transaldolase
LIGDLPLSLETSSPTGDIEEIISQAQDFHGWAPKTINVKINLTSQDLGIPYINGIMALISKDRPATLEEANSRFEELSDLMVGYKSKSGKVVYYLEAIHRLSKEGIPVNATAMMSVSQCFLAAQAGAKYVSLFNGRIANMGYDPMIETRKLRSLLDRAGLPVQIIAASSREAMNVVDWWDAGAHIVTVTPELVKPCIDHPYTRDTAALFDKSALDWLPGWREWKSRQGK